MEDTEFFMPDFIQVPSAGPSSETQQGQVRLTEEDEAALKHERQHWMTGKQVQGMAGPYKGYYGIVQSVGQYDIAVVSWEAQQGKRVGVPLTSLCVVSEAERNNRAGVPTPLRARTPEQSEPLQWTQEEVADVIGVLANTQGKFLLLGRTR